MVGSDGQILVFDLDGKVAAAMQLTLDDQRRAHVRWLVVDRTHSVQSRMIEERLLGVAMALGEAYGWADVDIAAA